MHRVKVERGTEEHGRLAAVVGIDLHARAFDGLNDASVTVLVEFRPVGESFDARVVVLEVIRAVSHLFADALALPLCPIGDMLIDRLAAVGGVKSAVFVLLPARTAGIAPKLRAGGIGLEFLAAAGALRGRGHR